MLIFLKEIDKYNLTRFMHWQNINSKEFTQASKHLCQKHCGASITNSFSISYLKRHLHNTINFSKTTKTG